MDLAKIMIILFFRNNKLLHGVFAHFPKKLFMTGGAFLIINLKQRFIYKKQNMQKMQLQAHYMVANRDTSFSKFSFI